MASIDASLLRGTIRLTPGRVEWCARAIKKRLRPDEVPTIGPVANEAEDAGRHARRLLETRVNTKKGIFSDVAKESNAIMDGATSGVFGYLDVLTRVYPPGTEDGDRARRLVTALFPRSLRPVTTGAFTEELSSVRGIVQRAKDEHAADVAAVPGLGKLLDVLDARANEFESVLEREEPTAPSYTEAESASVDADQRMLDLVNAIQFVYRGATAEAVARRTELLAPYVLQQENLRQRYRRRLRTVDIDPETGEELPEDPAAVTEASEANDPVPA